MERIQIKPPFIRLDAFLKFAGLCMSGGEAKTLITDGLISVNGEICLARGKKLYPGDRVAFEQQSWLVE